MLSQAGEVAAWPAGFGPKVFAYLKSGHPDHAALLKALVATGCRTVCYMPEVSAGGPQPVIDPLVRYASGPVDLHATLPDCDLCISHAGEATLAQSLLAGVPVLLMPMQAEQFLTARRVETAGAGINAAALRRPVDYATVIGSMLSNPAHRIAARGFAQRYADLTPQQHTLNLVDEFERLLR